jgi:hypothetical protein
MRLANSCPFETFVAKENVNLLTHYFPLTPKIISTFKLLN